MYNLREMQSFANVAASAVATAPLPVTRAYSRVLLEIRHDTSGGGGAASTLMTQSDMATHIEEVRIRVTHMQRGTVTLWEITGEDLIECINDFPGIASADGVLPLVFAHPYWDNPSSEDMFRLGTADLTSVQIEVKFDSTVVGPELKGFARELAGSNEPLGWFVKLSHITLSNSATGILEEPDIPVIGNGVGLKAMHFSTADIDGIELRADGTILYEDIPSLRPVDQDIMASRTGGRTGNANYTHVDLAGNRRSNIPDMSGVRDFRAKLNRTGTGSFRCITESVINYSQSPAG